MADNDDILEDTDFEKLLESFINSKNEDTASQPTTDNINASTAASSAPDASAVLATSATEDQSDGIIALSDFKDDDDDDAQEEPEEDELQLSPEGEAINEEITKELDQALFDSLSEAKTEAEAQENQPTLGSDESELAQAFVNFYTSVNKLSTEILNRNYRCEFEIDDLYPNYKPSTGRMLSEDLVNGWVLLVNMFPQEMGSFPLTSTDEQFLDFAEKLQNQDLQLAVISYVEILIDIESCELSYQTKLLKYQEKHIKRIMYEEYLARKERQRKFTEALAKQNFPVNAEQLISNYFRVAQKDVDGAFNALIKNPAIFAPIDFSKIKPRWFGLVKVSPKDGIRINMEMGNFLKKLKV